MVLQYLPESMHGGILLACLKFQAVFSGNAWGPHHLELTYRSVLGMEASCLPMLKWLCGRYVPVLGLRITPCVIRKSQLRMTGVENFLLQSVCIQLHNSHVQHM